jgi:hypothetical protein
MTDTIYQIDWDSATTDITLNGREISALSFQTSITRMKKDWNKLSPTDKHRLAACLFHLNGEYRKSIMGKGVRIVPRPPDAAFTCTASTRTSQY